ncbi:hypothetical protein CH330_09545 [candidate division WOR-3 bacterium JGI_Cruoil_03_51_56]|uniref:Uncharacterized protein n=1 Tax=candidate division WOR-3 bacterium JGI_Cruoil_03_51_56 TaxID=1973747 RepID=A0A235BNI3_UNCW3|nr:MAG: hypothetical protein CH330_09545 [candidate division WOR-3 bacterium JGI_Cruoil_03_51_56]
MFHMAKLLNRRQIPGLFCFFLMCRLVVGAEFYARRMEIVKTIEGQVSVFRDSVSIIDGDTRITAGMARVNESGGVAVICDSVFIESPDALVWADSAFYRLEEKQTELFGNVKVEQESLVIFAPLLLYSIPEKRVDADSGVVVKSKTGNFRLHGGHGIYDLAGDVGIIDSNPVMVQIADADSVTVTGCEMSWFARESKAQAGGKVRVNSGSAGLLCDTLIFFTARDSGLAWGNPRVSDSVSQTQGDTVFFIVRDGNLDVATIQGNAISYYTTEGGDMIAVTGQAIRISMESGKVAIIEIQKLLSGRLIRPVSALE